MRISVLLLLVLVAAGCTTHQGASTPLAEGFAVHMTGYDVPEPSQVPFADDISRREYLRFYHYAYLTTMWQDVPSHSTITPVSDSPEAATAGHYAGQEDAHRDKAEYWRQHGREYTFFKFDSATGAASYQPLRVYTP